MLTRQHCVLFAVTAKLRQQCFALPSEWLISHEHVHAVCQDTYCSLNTALLVLGKTLSLLACPLTLMHDACPYGLMQLISLKQFMPKI